jgi:glycosyltransferase involved in cell wall biosynthesis
MITSEVKIHSLSKYPILWAFQVKHLVAGIKPDIVDGHNANIYGFLAAMTGFHPLVVTAWGSDIFIQPWKNSFWKLITQYSLRRADVINCLFPMSVAEPALTKLGINISKVRITLLGVDTFEFKPIAYDIELAREIGVSSDKPLVINSRGFEPIYDYTTFFNAIPLVITEVPEAKFLALYKRGQREIGERLVHKLGIGDSVILREWLPRSMLPRLFSLADIYVSTSLSDGASNVLFEAMACELAPVVTDIPANRPWINDGENGFLFPLGDSKALAEHIIHLLKDQPLLTQFGKRCRQLVQEKAEQSQEMQKIEDIYRELVSAH